ncbi:MAG: hypothetical protein ACI85I_001535 [Arenicella sp.]|jgi:hypothetical protein
MFFGFAEHWIDNNRILNYKAKVMDNKRYMTVCLPHNQIKMIRKYTYIILCLLFSISSALAQSEISADVKIRIRNGDSYTNSPLVSLEFNYPKAVSMQISQSGDFLHENWIDYDKSIQSYELAGGDGKKTVYVKFKLKSGEITEVFTDDIILDTQPPKNMKLEFDMDGEYYNDTTLETVIYIEARDAKFMKLSNTKSFYADKWEVVKEDVDWKLARGDDGPRYVFAKFIDAAQNESETVFIKLILDREAPIGGGIEANSGNKFTIQQDRTVDLKLAARNADFMKVGVDEGFTKAEWKPYVSEIKKYPLGAEDGEKTIYVKYKDIANNQTQTLSTKIILDTTPPRDCQVKIDGDAETASEINKRVMLTFSATKDTKWVLVSNKSSFWGAKWRMYKPFLAWQLDEEENGERTVYVKFRDEAGNISKVFSDKIMLNRGF